MVSSTKVIYILTLEPYSVLKGKDDILLCRTLNKGRHSIHILRFTTPFTPPRVPTPFTPLLDTEQASLCLLLSPSLRRSVATALKPRADIDISIVPLDRKREREASALSLRIV